MAILVGVLYLVIGVVEILLWDSRETKKLWIYAAFLLAAGAFAVILTLQPTLQGPNPNDLLSDLWNSLKEGWQK